MVKKYLVLFKNGPEEPATVYVAYAMTEEAVREAFPSADYIILA